MNANGTNVRQLTNAIPSGEAGVCQVAWFPDNNRLAYSCQNGSRAIIRQINLDATGDVLLMQQSTNIYALFDLSLDWTKIVYEFGDHAWSPDSSIRVRNLSTTVDSQILAADGFADGQPRFSPDGSKVVLFGSRDVARGGYGAPMDLYVMNADGSNRTQLTTAAIDIQDEVPFWTSDGRIVFMRSIRGSPGMSEIYIINADGSNLTRLTNNAYDEHFPCIGFVNQ